MMIEGAHIARRIARRYRNPYPCAHYDDLYSEALLWLWHYRGQDDLSTKVHRKVISYLRKVFGREGAQSNTFREQPLPYEESAVQPDAESRTDHTIRLMRLTYKQREAFTRYMYGEEMKEIGKDLGVSEGAISQRIKAAKLRYAA